MVDYLEADEEPHDFTKGAIKIIRSLHSHGKVPVLAGGSTSFTIPLLDAIVAGGTKIFVVFLRSPAPIHEKRISSRIDDMIDRGLLTELEEMRSLEAQHLGNTSDWTRGFWKTIGYSEFYPYLISPEHPTIENFHAYADHSPDSFISQRSTNSKRADPKFHLLPFSLAYPTSIRDVGRHIIWRSLF